MELTWMRGSAVRWIVVGWMGYGGWGIPTGDAEVLDGVGWVELT